ncbi:MAG: Fic family protein [Candidatus Latescibacteria bacterium]|nr:Fic family protein [Candidatus Latescibacterota bacterium]
MTDWRPDQPYNRLPKLPPPADLETKAVLKVCVSARSSLAALKQATGLIPDPGILINTLPHLEAGASSAIENIVTTADKLFRYAQAEASADPATREALRYRAALLAGFKEMTQRPLNTRTAETVCSRIKNADVSVRRVSGTKIANERTGEVVYTPPEGEALLRDLLANWERFLHEQTDLDPLVRLAVGHYQFEAIHPFIDGNGRTGRVLNSLFLIHEDLLTLPVLYLSRYIINHKEEYYRLLLGITRNGAWEPWIVYMLTGINETAQWTTAKISAIRALLDHTANFVRERLRKIYSRELVTVIFEQPYCRIGNLTDAKVAKRVTASRYLKQLVDIGVLREETVGKEKLFIHPKLLTLLTEEGNEFPPYGRK